MPNFHTTTHKLAPKSLLNSALSLIVKELWLGSGSNSVASHDWKKKGCSILLFDRQLISWRSNNKMLQPFFFQSWLATELLPEPNQSSLTIKLKAEFRRDLGASLWVVVWKLGIGGPLLARSIYVDDHIWACWRWFPHRARGDHGWYP